MAEINRKINNIISTQRYEIRSYWYNLHICSYFRVSFLYSL